MSQGAAQVPTGGPLSATTFAGLLNTALVAILSRHSGPARPANGVGSAATLFQRWMDTTSATLVKERNFDGANDPRSGTLDTANSIWIPKQGGGLGSIASASTTNIWALPHTFVTITGTTTISLFDSSAENGEWKDVYAGGQFKIVNSANIVIQGGQDYTFTAGDTFRILYDGGGVTLVLNIQKNGATPGMGKPTGELFWMYGTGAVPGATRANGMTIGNTGSGGTDGTGPAYFNLYVKIHMESVNDSEIVVSGGRTAGGTAANALTDWIALKTITKPDWAGRLVGGLDNLGAGAKSRLTGTTMSPDGVTLGAVGGAQTVTLTQGNLPSVSFTNSGITLNNPTHSHFAVANNGGAGALTASNYLATVNTAGNAQDYNLTGVSTIASIGLTSSSSAGIAITAQGSAASGGSATPVNKVPPLKLATPYLAL